MEKQYKKRFEIDGKSVVITGAAGLLGEMHAKAVIEAGGVPILLDNNQVRLEEAKRRIMINYPQTEMFSYTVDITDKSEVEKVLQNLLTKNVNVYGLINNAANNPDMKEIKSSKGRFEDFPIEVWDKDLSVGLTGAFLCSQVFGSHMAEQKEGIIINISSDLGLIAPTQYLYEIEELSPNEQPKKPVTYSVVKTGLIGLSRYLATYWAEKNVRVNAIAFGGVNNNQNPKFIEKLVKHIPIGRMAERDEYICSIIYMLSDASSYMTGAVISVDGGRTAW